MIIKYIPEGDEFKASQLWGEGRHQLSILKNAMSFQNLKQDQRLVRFADGTIIKCLSCFDRDVINIFVPQVFVGGEPEYREREEITYLPAFNAYNSDKDFIGVIICRGGGFEPSYEFIPTKEELPDDTPDDVDFEEAADLRKWGYNDKRYEDIIPTGKYNMHRTVSETPNNASTLTWKYTFGSICQDDDGFAGYFNRYERTNTYNHNKAATFGEDSDTYWQPVYWEGVDNYYRKPREFILNLGELPFYDRYIGYGDTGLVETIGFASGPPCGDSVPEAEAIARAAFSTWELAWNPDTTHYPESGRTLVGDYREWEEFAWQSTAAQIYSHYNVEQIIFDFGDVFIGSIEDPDHFAVIYSTWKYKRTETVSFDYTGNPFECLPYEADNCGHGRGDYHGIEETIFYDIEKFKLGLSGLIYNIADYPEILGAIPIQDYRVRHFRIGGYEIGLYWLLGYVDSDYISNYIMVKKSQDGEIIVTPLTGNSPWNSWYEFPDLKDSEGSPVYIKDYGHFRLISETVTIKEMATAEQPGVFRKII